MSNRKKVETTETLSRETLITEKTYPQFIAAIEENIDYLNRIVIIDLENPRNRSLRLVDPGAKSSVFKLNDGREISKFGMIDRYKFSIESGKSPTS